MGSKKRRSDQSLEIQVRELRNDVDKVMEAVEHMERAVMRAPCWPWYITGMCGIANMPGQMCGPPEWPAGTNPGPICGPPLQEKRRGRRKKKR